MVYIADDLLDQLNSWVAEGILELERYLAKYAAFESKYGR